MSSINDFDWTDKEISEIRDKLSLIKSFLLKPINDKNFNDLYTTCYLLIARMPITKCDLSAHHIYRGRPNTDKDFTEEWEISYNSKNIDLIKLGRFNRPKEPVFYGAVPNKTNTNNCDAVLTACIECNKEILSKNTVETIFDTTIGQWNLNRPIEVINLCYEERFLEYNAWHNENSKSLFDNLEQNLPKKTSDLIKEVRNFFSTLAGEKKEIPQQHFLTTAFFCAVKMYYSHVKKEIIHGIVYPSTMTDNIGLNVVLMKDTVDNFLELREVFVDRLVRDVANMRFSRIRQTEVAQVVDKKFQLRYSNV